jgi:hypothetical protein
LPERASYRTRNVRFTALRLLLATLGAGVLFFGGFLIACGTAEKEDGPTQQRVTVTENGTTAFGIVETVTVTENGTTATGIVETLDSGDVITKFDRQVEPLTITAPEPTTGP